MTMPGYDEVTARAEARVGSVLLNKYRIDGVLGVGGMAVVYRVTHRNQAELALKMLHLELGLSDDIRRRFLREGYAANSVKHPGVVLIVDDDIAEDGAAFLVMEMLQGAPLDILWEDCGNRLSLRAVLSVAHQLLDVLVAAHAKGIVHRDIKPANLFITHDGTLKVLDFGIARVREAAASISGYSTGSGITLGTPAFMAPEQAYAKSSEIDGQTDVWAVGATLFYLLTGERVHQGENPAQVMIRVATSHARSVASLVADTPPSLTHLIDRALLYDKTARWPSAAAMQEAVARISQELFREAPSKMALVNAQSVPTTARLPPRVTGPQPEPAAPGVNAFVATAGTPAILDVAGHPTAQPVSTGLSSASPGSAAPPIRRYGWVAWAAAGVAVACGVAFGLSRMYAGSPATATATTATASVATARATPVPAAATAPPAVSASAAVSAEPVVARDYDSGGQPP